MWKTGWKVLVVLILVAILVSFRGKDTAVRKGAELVNGESQIESMPMACSSFLCSCFALHIDRKGENEYNRYNFGQE